MLNGLQCLPSSLAAKYSIILNFVAIKILFRLQVDIWELPSRTDVDVESVRIGKEQNLVKPSTAPFL